MKKTLALAACVLLAAGFAACNTDKAPADAAIKAAEQAIQAVADDAGKYVPGQLKQAQDALATAKEKFAKGEYKEALAAGTDLANKATELAKATAAKKAELTKAWEELSASIPQMLGAITTKVAELGSKKKLPKGLDAAKLTQAKDGLAGMTKAWDEASAAFTAGNLGEALGRASSLKEKGAEIMALLGMAPPAAPAPAAPAAPAK
jgi:predicted small secreted protein